MPFDISRRTEAHSPAVEFRDFDDTGLRVTFAHTYSEIAGGDYLHLSISKNDDENVFGFNFVNNELGLEHVPKVHHRSDVGWPIEIAHVFSYSITENGKKIVCEHELRMNPLQLNLRLKWLATPKYSWIFWFSTHALK